MQSFSRYGGNIHHIMYGALQMPLVMSMVAAGQGVSILPQFLKRIGMTGVVFRPLDPPSPTTEIALVTRADGNETMVSAFLRIARTLERPLRSSLPAAQGLHVVSALS